MFFNSLFPLLAIAVCVVAIPDPLITPAAQLHPRQDDPSLVGWVSTSGQSQFAAIPRSCDFPATLSSSGSYAQCCTSGEPCNFWTTCRDGAVADASTSVFCDLGYCNTGVIVPTVGGSGSLSNLGCFPTTYGSAPFQLVQNIGDAPVATETPSGNPTSGGQSSSQLSSRTTSQHTSTGSAAPSSTSEPGRAEQLAADSWIGGLLGMVAVALL